MAAKAQKTFDLSKLRTNPDNPYPEREADFPKFLEKLRKYPHWLELRPIVYDDQDVQSGKFLILGGNKRFKGLLALDYKEVPATWVKPASGLTDAEKHEFILGDNAGFGDWDIDTVLENWGEDMAGEWSIEIPDFEDEYEADFSGGDEVNDKNNFGVIVKTVDAVEQEKVYNWLIGQGYDCKIVVV